MRRSGQTTSHDVKVSMATILIVDDTKFGRNRVRAALGTEQFQLVEAADGQDALEKFAEVQPDLIISDLLMPRMTGFDLVRELRARGDRTPAIIVSADIQHSSREACAQLQVAGFLNKPFEPHALRTLVDAVLCQAAEASK